MKKLLGILVIIAVAVTCFIHFGQGKKSKPADNSKPVIKIGATLPLSGDFGHIADSNMKALTLALDELKNKNTKFTYELVFEDDNGTSKQGALNVAKLVNIDKVKAIISMWGLVGPVAGDIAGKSKIIHFGCGSGKGISAPHYSFNNYTPPHKSAELVIDKLKKSSVQKIAVVVSNSAPGDDISSALVEAANKKGVGVVSVEKFMPGTKDFRIAIAKMDKDNPDIYIAWLYVPDIKIFVNQLHQVTGKRNVASIDAFHELNASDYPVVEGLWFTKSAAGTPEFADKLLREKGAEIQSCTGNSYDSLNIIINAYENTPIKDGNVFPLVDDIRDTILKSKSNEGALGGYYINEERVIVSEPTLNVIKNGKIIELKE